MSTCLPDGKKKNLKTSCLLLFCIYLSVHEVSNRLTKQYNNSSQGVKEKLLETAEEGGRTEMPVLTRTINDTLHHNAQI